MAFEFSSASPKERGVIIKILYRLSWWWWSVGRSVGWFIPGLASPLAPIDSWSSGSFFVSADHKTKLKGDFVCPACRHPSAAIKKTTPRHRVVDKGASFSGSDGRSSTSQRYYKRRRRRETEETEETESLWSSRIRRLRRRATYSVVNWGP